MHEDDDGDRGAEQSGDEGGGSGRQSGAGGGRNDRRSGDDGVRGGDQEAQHQEASSAEKVVIAISVAFTLLLFAYAGWQILTPVTADTPQVSVVETETLQNGDVAVSVQVRNPKDVGLVTVTVQSDCTAPPTAVQLSYVPASSTRTATLVCPPGTTDPNVSIDNWVTR